MQDVGLPTHLFATFYVIASVSSAAANVVGGILVDRCVCDVVCISAKASLPRVAAGAYACVRVTAVAAHRAGCCVCAPACGGVTRSIDSQFIMCGACILAAAGMGAVPMLGAARVRTRARSKCWCAWAARCLRHVASLG